MQSATFTASVLQLRKDKGSSSDESHNDTSRGPGCHGWSRHRGTGLFCGRFLLQGFVAALLGPRGLAFGNPEFRVTREGIEAMAGLVRVWMVAAKSSKNCLPKFRSRSPSLHNVSSLLRLDRLDGRRQGQTAFLWNWLNDRASQGRVSYFCLGSRTVGAADVDLEPVQKQFWQGEVTPRICHCFRG